MKALIWLLTAFSVFFLNGILGMATGVRLGPIFTFPIIFFVARWFCRSRDEKEHEESRRIFAVSAAADRAAMLAEAGLGIEPEDGESPEGWKTCPTCGRLVREGYLCSVCKPKLEDIKRDYAEISGSPLTAAEKPSVLKYKREEKKEAEEPSSPIRYCRKCGFKLLEGSNFCSECGAPKVNL